MSNLRTAMTGASNEARQQTPYERFRIQMNQVRQDIGKLIGEQNVDRFVRIVLNAVQYNPQLLGADRRSLMLAAMEAAQDGLMPDGNEAVFNIYPTKDREESKRRGTDVWIEQVQYLPMVYGLIQKIYETGATFVDAVAVRERDEFDYERGDSPRILHKPYREDNDPGKVVAAYVVVKYPKLETKREVMFRRDIELVRSKSKAKDGLMWKDFYDQAAIKSVIHRIYKQLPQSERLNRVLAADNRAVGLEGVETTTPAEATGVDLAALVDGRLEASMRQVPTAGQGAQPARDAVTIDQQKVEPSAATATPTPETATAGPAAATGAATATGGPGGQADATPLPKPGDPGTAELKTKFLSQLSGAGSRDVLDIVMDDIRFFKWEADDLKQLETVYRERVAHFAT